MRQKLLRPFVGLIALTLMVTVLTANSDRIWAGQTNAEPVSMTVVAPEKSPASGAVNPAAPGSGAALPIDNGQAETAKIDTTSTAIPLNDSLSVSMSGQQVDYISVAKDATVISTGRKVVVDGTTFKLPRPLTKAIEAKVLEYPGKLFNFDFYEVKSVMNVGDWYRMSLGTLGIPTDVLGMIKKNQITEWGTPMIEVLANKDKNGQWVVSIDGTTNFYDQVKLTPENVISSGEKAALVKEQIRNTIQSGTSTMSPQAVQQAMQQTVSYLFPWPAGTSRTIRDIGWHSGGNVKACPDIYFCGLDFMISSGITEDYRVLAAADGYIQGMCNTNTIYLDILDADGVTTRYMHVDPKTIRNGINKGARVQQGTVFGYSQIGDISDKGCGWASQTVPTAHLHWNLPKATPLVVDGVKISYADNLPSVTVPYTSSNQPRYLCGIAPATGTWYLSNSCYIWSNITPPGNLEVNSNSVVTLNSGSRIDMNFVSNKIVIKSGSKVIIKSGSVIN